MFAIYKNTVFVYDYNLLLCLLYYNNTVFVYDYNLLLCLLYYSNSEGYVQKPPDITKVTKLYNDLKGWEQVCTMCMTYSHTNPITFILCQTMLYHNVLNIIMITSHMISSHP